MMNKRVNQRRRSIVRMLAHSAAVIYAAPLQSLALTKREERDAYLRDISERLGLRIVARPIGDKLIRGLGTDTIEAINDTTSKRLREAIGDVYESLNPTLGALMEEDIMLGRSYTVRRLVFSEIEIALYTCWLHPQ